MFDKILRNIAFLTSIFCLFRFVLDQKQLDFNSMWVGLNIMYILWYLSDFCYDQSKR